MLDTGLTYFGDVLGQFISNFCGFLWWLDSTVAFGDFTYLEVLIGAGVFLVITSTLAKWIIDFIP